MTNLKDMQVYILNRLDTEPLLKSKFAKQCNSIDMLNSLLFKAHYCVLYVEKVFDLILGEAVEQSDIAHIPATLHGLYHFLLAHLSVQQAGSGDMLSSVLGISMVLASSFSKNDVFRRLKSRYVTLEFNEYEKVFDAVSIVLFKKKSNSSNEDARSSKFEVFHTSFQSWFVCAKENVHYLDEAHFTLSLFYLGKLKLGHKRSDEAGM